ncbi:acyl-CoA thioesterase [Rothia sp. AR01]|uniref:Acyl-CoA thioesterase n=1 Tax=Rothia santali TaxID=2949643 RepID=A0A9X2HF38_9MICC|nr:acyl-CoA thioesterase [Rothia santali]MCP3426950.1 acyl-CoA thioesterase [Rothia santali]
MRYHEVDQQGFLFNGRYFEIADVALTEFFRSLGWTYLQLNAAGLDPSVVHAEANFYDSVVFDDAITVETACTKVGRSSFRLTTKMSRDGVRVAQLDIVYTNVDVKVGFAVPLPEKIVTEMKKTMPHGALHESIARAGSASGEEG